VPGRDGADRQSRCDGARRLDVPTYQYACTVCDHQLEAVQSFSDAALTVCPECDGRLRKVFSSVGVVFKGPGFYRTDSRSGSPTDGAAKSEATSASSGNGGDATKSSAPASNGGSSESSTTSSGNGTKSTATVAS
jgi:putative FmdB family regulatory protein